MGRLDWAASYVRPVYEQNKLRELSHDLSFGRSLSNMRVELTVGLAMTKDYGLNNEIQTNSVKISLLNYSLWYLQFSADV